VTQQEFNRIVIYGTEEELQEAVQKYPKLMQTCAEQIEAELNSTMVPPISEQWYQRLVDAISKKENPFIDKEKIKCYL